ncbi:MAG: hypothetical protein ACI9SG_000283 [Maribacter sp.]|jgi:hypothetical protein
MPAKSKPILLLLAKITKTRLINLIFNNSFKSTLVVKITHCFIKVNGEHQKKKPIAFRV